MHQLYRNSSVAICACCLLFFLVLVACTPPCLAQQQLAADLVQDGQPINLQQEKFGQLFAELRQKHGFSTQELQNTFQGAAINRQVLVLMDKQWEAKPYYLYAPMFITAENIRNGKEKLLQYQQLLDRVEATFGVDRETVVAIWGVETKYGAREGNFDVLQTLLTLFDAYPRRSDFFRGQLVHFLLLCRENRIDAKGIKGSYAAAFGQTQFIPSSYCEYAVDFDSDGKRDVWNSVPDILASIANYLKRHHWTLKAPVYAELGNVLGSPTLAAAEQKGRKEKVAFDQVRKAQDAQLPPSPGNRPLTIVGLELPPGGQFPRRYVAGYPNFQAITEWNHSNRYAMAVSELAKVFNH